MKHSSIYLTAKQVEILVLAKCVMTSNWLRDTLLNRKAVPSHSTCIVHKNIMHDNEKYLNYILFLSLKIVFVLENSTGPDETQCYYYKSGYLLLFP